MLNKYSHKLCKRIHIRVSFTPLNFFLYFVNIYDDVQNNFIRSKITVVICSRKNNISH